MQDRCERFDVKQMEKWNVFNQGMSKIGFMQKRREKSWPWMSHFVLFQMTEVIKEDWHLSWNNEPRKTDDVIASLLTITLNKLKGKATVLGKTQWWEKLKTEQRGNECPGMTESQCWMEWCLVSRKWAGMAQSVTGANQFKNTEWLDQRLLDSWKTWPSETKVTSGRQSVMLNWGGAITEIYS